MRKYLLVLGLVLAAAAAYLALSGPGPTTAKPSSLPALIIGQPTAKLTVVVYGDFTSQTSRRFFQEIEPALQSEFIDSGKVKLEWHNFADSTGSELAAQAARCANDQNFFQQFHDAVLSSTGDLSSASLKKLAGQSSDLINQSDFDQCLDSGKYAQAVKDETAAARTQGLNQSSFLIGHQLINGFQPYSIFKPAIEAQL